MPETIEIVAKVTDADGQESTWSGTLVKEDAPPPPLVVTGTVVPQSAPAGTERTITITASGGVPPFSYTCTADGVPLTAVPGSPNVFKVTV